MWTLRTNKKGSIALLQDYKKVMIEKLLETDEPIGSGAMHQHLIDTMNGDHPSRASVIFFFNALVNSDYAKSNDTTGKGGHHNLYYTDLTKTQFKNCIKKDIKKSLNNALLEIFN